MAQVVDQKGLYLLKGYSGAQGKSTVLWKAVFGNEKNVWATLGRREYFGRSTVEADNYRR